MPNWCFTSMSIEGPKNEIDVLQAEIDKATENASIETDFGHAWLGHLLDHIGEWDHETETPSCKCRGSICYMERPTEEALSIGIESAWAPHLGPILLFRDIYAPSAQIIYEAEEPGNGLFCTNDDSEGLYKIDVWEPEKVPAQLKDSGRITEEVLQIFLSEILKKNASLKELIEEAEDTWGDYLSIIKYELAEPEEWIE